MLRSKLLWKLYASYALLILTTVAVARFAMSSTMVVVTVAMALVLAWWLARRFTRPVLAMTRAAEAIARGAYAQRVPALSRDELGQLATAFNAMNDELRRAMATVGADRQKLTAIFSSMVEGVVAVDRDERIVHMNQVAGRFLGAATEDVTGRPIWEVTRIREILEILSETLRSEAVGHRTVRLPGTADRFLDVHVSPLRSDTETLAGAVLVFHDVTRLRRLETVRRDFIGNVSHELKTPVTAIRGLVETLIDDGEIEPAIRDRFMGKIARQAERMSNLVTDLLSLCRLESEDQPLERAPLDVRDVLAESARALAPASEARRVAVTRDWPDEPLVVDGDQEALRQAVTNLLSNAVKYSPEDGEVTLSACRDDGDVVIAVTDRGPGIEPRHHERLFERFYRVDAARSRELGGTGLGLAIVKHTALALGGDVAVDSVPGAGSTFRIRLPAAREEASGFSRITGTSSTASDSPPE